MKETLKFIGGWIASYFLFAGLMLIANWKTVDYLDCLHNPVVCGLGIFLGWIGGLKAAGGRVHQRHGRILT